MRGGLSAAKRFYPRGADVGGRNRMQLCDISQNDIQYSWYSLAEYLRG